jgi:type IV pilus assembly protein PilF
MIRAALVLSVMGLLAGCISNQNQEMGTPQPERASEINLRLGTDYLVKGNLTAAKEKIDKALEQNPRNASAHAIAGLLYDRLNDADKAENSFQRALSLDGKSPEIANNYAAFLCKNSRFERGEKYALQAARNPLYKTPEVAYMNAGNCQRQAGNLERAEAHYRSALEIKPRMPGALFEMAEVELSQANYRSSQAFMQRYLEVSKTSPATLWLGVRIERGLGNTAVANNYAARLKNEYPTAVETKELLESERTPK